jgi:hypothetical protein
VTEAAARARSRVRKFPLQLNIWNKSFLNFVARFRQHVEDGMSHFAKPGTAQRPYRARFPRGELENLTEPKDLLRELFGDANRNDESCAMPTLTRAKALPITGASSFQRHRGIKRTVAPKLNDKTSKVSAH